MLPDAQLQTRLRTLHRRVVHGPWYRVVDYSVLTGPPPGMPDDIPPQPLWPGGPKRRGARFTPLGGADALYLTSDPLTAFAETNRVFLVPGGPIFPLRAVPTVVLTIEGVIADVLDLTDPAILEQLGTTIAEVTGDWRYSQSLGQIPPTQRLARAAYATGAVHGIRYLSAKQPDQGHNLVVFTDRLTCEHGCFLAVYDPAGHLFQRFPPPLRGESGC